MIRFRRFPGTRRVARAGLQAAWAVLGTLTIPASVLAVVLQENLWVTNNTVTATAVSGNVLYLAGSFDHVGPATGAFAALDPSSGAALQPYSEIVGSVLAVAPDGNSGWYIGGTFTSVRGQPRHNLAHLNASGSVTGWAPIANDEVRTLAVSGNVVYAGGKFTSIDGQPRNHIAALDAASGALTTWNADVNDAVHTLLVLGGRLYVGGRFTSIGGQPRGRLAALDPGTGALTSWTADTDASVHSLGNNFNTLYVGGNFTSIGGQPRRYLAAVDATTGSISSFNPDADQVVFTLRVRTLETFPFTVTVYAGGDFTSIGGQPRNRIGAVNGVSGTATSWNPDADNQVLSLLVREPHHPNDPLVIYAGGLFTGIGGQPRNRIAALDAAGGAATSWNPSAGYWVRQLAGGDPLIVAGDFASIGGQPRNHLAAFDLSTGVATSWDPNANDRVSSLVKSGSTVYVGGHFTSVGGQPRAFLAAIDATSGGLLAWNPSADAGVLALSVADKVYAGGLFTNIGGISRNYCAALDATTGAVTSFDPNADGIVQSLAARTLNEFPFTTTVYAGGAFTNIGGQPRSRIAALSATSGSATTWNPGANGSVYALAIREKIRPLDPVAIYVGGSFTNIAGQPRRYLARLDLGTGSAASFDPNPDTFAFPTPGVTALRLNGNLLYVGGSFDNIGGQPHRGLAAVDGTTGTAMNWNPGTDYLVYSFAQVGSTVYAGGAFSSVLGEPRSCIVGLTVVSTDVGEISMSGEPFRLRVAPNPFHSGTALHFALAASAEAEVAVYDPAGRLVRQLRRGSFTAGEQSLMWDGRDETGRPVGAGLYLLRVTAGARTTSQKVLRLR